MGYLLSCKLKPFVARKPHGGQVTFVIWRSFGLQTALACCYEKYRSVRGCRGFAGHSQMITTPKLWLIPALGSLIWPVIAPIPQRSDGDRANCAASAPARSRVRRNAPSPPWADAASDRRCEPWRLPPHRSRVPIPRHRCGEEGVERGTRLRSREENRREPQQHP